MLVSWLFSIIIPGNGKLFLSIISILNFVEGWFAFKVERKDIVAGTYGIVAKCIVDISFVESW